MPGVNEPVEYLTVLTAGQRTGLQIGHGLLPGGVGARRAAAWKVARCRPQKSISHSK